MSIREVKSGVDEAIGLVREAPADRAAEEWRGLDLDTPAGLIMRAVVGLNAQMRGSLVEAGGLAMETASQLEGAEGVFGAVTEGANPNNTAELRQWIGYAKDEVQVQTNASLALSGGLKRVLNLLFEAHRELTDQKPLVTQGVESADRAAGLVRSSIPEAAERYRDSL